jgi:SRSO17 transposase
VLGLLSDLPVKNCWAIAEYVGDATPDGPQHLLARAVWDTDGVRDDLRDYVVEHLGDSDAVLVVDETGDVEKGTYTVGVHTGYACLAAPLRGSGIQRTALLRLGHHRRQAPWTSVATHPP